MFHHATVPTPLDLKTAIVREPLVVTPETTVMVAIATMSRLQWTGGVHQPSVSIVPKALQGRVDDLFRKARASCVLVVTDGHLVGMLTAQDVVFLMSQQISLKQFAGGSSHG